MPCDVALHHLAAQELTAHLLLCFGGRAPFFGGWTAMYRRKKALSIAITSDTYTHEGGDESKKGEDLFAFIFFIF